MQVVEDWLTGPRQALLELGDLCQRAPSGVPKHSTDGGVSTSLIR